ncbi:MAG: HPP family protein, partial [Burkholderiales bacterium]
TNSVALSPCICRASTGMAPAVGLSLFGMQTLRITHPPAGAIPVLALQMQGDSATLFVTLLVGCLGMLLLALIVHRLPPRRIYPAPHPGLPVQTHTSDAPVEPER